AQPAGEKDPKRGKSKESDDVVTQKMPVQLEARMRTQEHYAMAQVKKDGPQHERGPPELHLFSRALGDIEGWLTEASSFEVKKYIGLPTRVRSMLEHGKSEGASEWIKDSTFSPMYDVKKVRLTMSIRGHVLVATAGKHVEKLNKAQQEAWGGAPTDDKYEEVLQRTPLETPAVPEGAELVELQHALSVILR
ncbi:unnamed protein product, partial [Prorocentrum cordatum]